MKQLLLQYVTYNHWANQRIVTILNSNKALLNVESKSSFPTLKKTFFHLWDAEYVWLNRMNGEPITSWPSTKYQQDVPLNKCLETSKNLIEFVTANNEELLNASCTYKNMQQDEFSQSYADIIMHCINHSTYHRGQLVTMMRQLGVTTIPATDFIVFLKEKQK
ncbi:MAG: DinB family protein [Bacteroidia bacterium]